MWDRIGSGVIDETFLLNFARFVENVFSEVVEIKNTQLLEYKMIRLETL